MFSYIGGKSQIGKWIKDYIPTDIKTYVEPFSGAYWVYFNLDISQFQNLETVIYNDFNPVNSNLFNCLKTPEEFYEFIKDETCQFKSENLKGQNCKEEFREKFNRYQKSAFSNKYNFDINNPNFQWGMEYAYVITQVFSGSKPETSKFIDLKHTYRSKFDTFRDKVGGIGQGKKYPGMLKRITDVENLDFEEVIKKYDNEDAYFYVDPPYFRTENYYSNHDFDRNDHERLAKCLKNTKGKWSLSYYYFDLLEEWFPKDEYKWVSKEFSKAASATKGQTQNKGEELLIMNY
jgi:DNA adenine methylase